MWLGESPLVPPDALKTRLLGAIESGSLVFLCGAGLSVAPPSNLPLAAAVAARCYAEWSAIESLDPTLSGDVDALAAHFHARSEFRRFLSLVPWSELVGPPNNGHAAIGDLLISRAAHAALSANFDRMIERWAEDRKVALRGALDGAEAVAFTTVSAPLLKFHGCSTRDPDNTLWTHRQLDDELVKKRLDSCRQWMATNLPGKDLVVVGFWTDWGYLNEILADAFTTFSAQSVTVVDPSAGAELETKAPVLWKTLNDLSAAFTHIEASGADFLDALRTAYSQTWIRRFYESGRTLVTASGGAMPTSATPDSISGEELYNLRRDVEGVPYTRAAILKKPPITAQQTSQFYLELLGAGARQEGAWLRHRGQAIRVVNGAGRNLSEMRSAYVEPGVAPKADVVVCVGALDVGVPSRIIPAGSGSSVVRSAPGDGSRWVTSETARAEFLG